MLHQIYGADGWQIPQLLPAMDAAEDFYFDSISQIGMDSWVKGRIALVRDAGYSPGPAVGGGTSIAMIGAYVLAQELAHAGRNYHAGFHAYQNRMRGLAASSGQRARNFVISSASRVLPWWSRSTTAYARLS